MTLIPIPFPFPLLLLLTTGSVQALGYPMVVLNLTGTNVSASADGVSYSFPAGKSSAYIEASTGEVLLEGVTLSFDLSATNYCRELTVAVSNGVPAVVASRVYFNEYSDLYVPPFRDETNWNMFSDFVLTPKNWQYQHSPSWFYFMGAGASFTWFIFGFALRAFRSMDDNSID